MGVLWKPLAAPTIVSFIHFQIVPATLQMVPSLCSVAVLVMVPSFRSVAVLVMVPSFRSVSVLANGAFLS